MPEFEATGTPFTFNRFNSYQQVFVLPALPDAPDGQHWQVLSFRATGTATGGKFFFVPDAVDVIDGFVLNYGLANLGSMGFNGAVGGASGIVGDPALDAVPPHAFECFGTSLIPDAPCTPETLPIHAVRSTRHLGESFYPYVTLEHLFFTCELAAGECPGGGGGGGGGGPAEDGAGGVDVNHWKRGYFIAQADSDALRLHRSWHSDQKLDYTAVIAGGGASGPRLSHPLHGPPLGVVFSKGADKNAAIYRRVSYDYGETWLSDPRDGSPAKTGANGLKHAAEVWNERTGERCLFYNDSSEVGTDGQPTGKGKIYVQVAGPESDPDTSLLVIKGDFKVSDLLADDCSFGAEYISHPTRFIDCMFISAGVRHVLRSADDCRSFWEWS